jgi:hypothetical protein
MVLLRRSLGRWVTACLLLQAASLSALLPRDCCRAHAHERQEESGPSCHTAPEKTEDRCALRGTCDGPMSAMVAQLSQVGVIPATAGAPADEVRSSLLAVKSESSSSRLPSPDSPPPRG